MPTLDDIHIELHCHHEVSTIGVVEEIAPRRPSSSDADNGIHMPLLYDEVTNTASVFVPAFHQSNFWLAYHIKPVPQDASFFYVFKMFINREEVVTWSCGVENDWEGKTMFSLFDTGALAEDGKGMSKRAFYFGGAYQFVGDLSSDRCADRLIEVRVCRADKKLRAPRQLEDYEGQGHGNGIDVVNAGFTPRGHPQRFYIFGLLDRIDKPFATFRFFYRTWEELDLLGLRMGQVETENGSSVFCPPDKPSSSRPVQDFGTTLPQQSTNSGHPMATPPLYHQNPTSGAYTGQFPGLGSPGVLPILYSNDPRPTSANFLNVGPFNRAVQPHVGMTGPMPAPRYQSVLDRSRGLSLPNFMMLPPTHPHAAAVNPPNLMRSFRIWQQQQTRERS